MPATADAPGAPPTSRVVGLTAALGLAAVVLGVDLTDAGPPPGETAWWALPVLAVLAAVGEYLLVGFRYRGQVNTWNLMEAAMAPLLFAFPGAAAMVAVAVGQAAGGVLTRNAWLKTAFNMAQWSVAAGIGSLVVLGLTEPGDDVARSAGAVVVGLAAVAVVNQVAMTTVLAVVNRHTPRQVLTGLAAVVLPRWLIGWATNVVVALLFVLAYASHPAAVVLFPLPLWALHLAQRSASRAAADRRRQTTVHRALQVLARPLDPADAMPAFIEELGAAFPGASVSLAISDERGTTFHRVSGDRSARASGRSGGDSLECALLAAGGSGRVAAEATDPRGEALSRTGHADCVYATFDTPELRVLLAVLDQQGFESTPAAEVAFVESVVREAAVTLGKGRLFASVLDERRKLAEIVGSTSDGILTVGTDGAIRTWNPALERITGLRAAAAIGTSAALTLLQPRTLHGEPVDLTGWAQGARLPADLRITSASGEPRRLACSYSRAVDERTGTETLVLVARDLSSAEQMEALRAQFGRLVQVEAAQREIVDQLQQALMPPAPYVPGTELAVRYVSSDPAAPTGGDLYDWQVLPDGDLHLAVVDVLGHGVEATRHALMVMHALRVLTLQGRPLEEVVAAADAVLGAQDPDLVATVVVARYRPADGLLRIAGGGHPHALVASTHDGVREVPAPGGAVGWPEAGSRGIAEVRLAEGDVLLLYTDGLVEARKDILEGTEQLLAEADRLAHLPVSELSTRLLDAALAGAERRDDSLLLVLRRTAGRRVGRWSAPPSVEHVPRLRHQLMAALHERGVADGLDDVALVASELVTNAIRAARSVVEVDAVLTSEGVELAVTDDGVGFDDRPAAPEASLAESGRGLSLVGTLSTRCSIRTSPSGSTVRVQLPAATTGGLAAADEVDGIELRPAAGARLEA